MAEVLTASQLDEIKQHKYSVTGTSICEPPFQVFWRWLVERIPLWWAPNAITMAGLLCNIAASLLLVWHCPTATEPAPPYALVLCAVALFVYQTLDAIDGKQARRTNSSSPLGELFDHGCDSVSCIFVMLSIAVTLQLGTSLNWLFGMYFWSQFAFYAAHWQTYVSGTMRFNRLDVTEAQLMFISAMLLSAIFGVEFWAWRPLPMLTNLALKHLFVSVGVSSAVVAMFNFISVILFTGGCGKNGSTVANTSVLFPILPFLLVFLLGLLCRHNSNEQLFDKHPCLFLLAFGLVAAKVSNRLVVAHMSKGPIALLDTALIGPCILYGCQYFRISIPEKWLLFLCLLLGGLDLWKYSANVVKQISDYLDIAVFHVNVAAAAPTDNGRQAAPNVPTGRRLRSQAQR